MSAAYPVRIFVGMVAPLPGDGRLSGIRKFPVEGPITLNAEGFFGDQQADRQVHGGPDKAIHLFPSEHYAALARRFPEAAPLLVPGSIGENLAATGLTEADVGLGEVFALGATRLQVCQPRSPCWKIDTRYGVDGIAAYIAEMSLTGWYCRVLQSGPVMPGDALRRLGTPPAAPSLAEAATLCRLHRPPLDDLERLAATPGIAAGWRQKILERAAWLARQSPSPH